MPRIPATVRITFGLISIVITALMAATLFGLFPNRRDEVLKSRTRVCESLAINFSMMAHKNDLETMRRVFQTVAQRTPEIRSIGVRRDDDDLLLEIGDHARHWTLSRGEKATDDEYFVEILGDGKLWGRLEVAFAPWTTGTLERFLRTEFAHAGFVGLFLVVGFYAYLRFVLRQLDPSRVVPNRVREALDTLAEGLLVLDHNERIVLANRAFTRATGTQDEHLIGKPVDSVPFVPKDDAPAEALPWTEVIRSGTTVKGRLFAIETPGEEDRTFSVSASPIHDENGKQRGVLASFEDVSHLERKKRELKTMVDYLRVSSDEIKRQNRELTRLATRDSLTGCLNRRAFFERFDAEWKKSERYGDELSVMMVDVDHFKSINDTHGHSMGDEVLREVGAALQKTARETDIVCRYGGEEFAVLMPNTCIDEAQIAAERLRIAISRLKFQVVAITASLGVSSRSQKAQDPQALLDQADKCLYVAKRGGRNRVVRWDQVPADLVVDEAKVSRGKAEVPQESASIPFHAVTALISALAYRDQATAEHSRRVADLCVATGEGLMSLGNCYTLEVAALLHDIGKFGVPDSILLKPGPLTDEEWRVMRRNDKIGVEIVRASFASPEMMAILENYQTKYSGEPSNPSRQLVGNEIPLGARILAIADAFDSMVTDRVFRKGRTRQEAFQELRRCAGTQFDPELVERFIATTRSLYSDHSRSVAMSKEAALFIGLQIESLSKALDNHDLPAIDALSRRLHSTALKNNASEIAEKAQSLEQVLNSDRDLMAVIQTAGELLDLCRATQREFLKQTGLDSPVLDPSARKS